LPRRYRLERIRRSQWPYRPDQDPLHADATTRKLHAGYQG
jgi:hypothetical protein